jgi:hypothetical protein
MLLISTNCAGKTSTRTLLPNTRLLRRRRSIRQPTHAETGLLVLNRCSSLPLSVFSIQSGDPQDIRHTHSNPRLILQDRVGDCFCGAIQILFPALAREEINHSLGDRVVSLQIKALRGAGQGRKLPQKSPVPRKESIGGQDLVGMVIL